MSSPNEGTGWRALLGSAGGKRTCLMVSIFVSEPPSPGLPREVAWAAFLRLPELAACFVA